MTATSHGDDFGQDGDGNLVRRDGAEIEPGRRLEPGEPLGRDAAPGQLGLERGGLFAAADERHVIRLDREEEPFRIAAE